MTYHDAAAADGATAADLAAVRETVSARLAGTDQSLSRSWAAIAAGRSVPAASRPPVRGRWLVPAGAAVAVAGLALGTVALLGGTEGGVDPADLEFPRITDPREIVFPIDEYGYTTEGYATFVEASAHLVNECLRRFGVDVPEPGVTRGPLPDFQADNARRYGVFDLEMAREYGYGVPPGWGDVWPEGVDPADYDPAEERANAWQMTEDEEFLYVGRTKPRFAGWPLPTDRNGDPLREDGCNGEAVWVLSGGLSGSEGPDWRITNNDAEIRAEQDTRVQAVYAEWSECMRRAGYDYQQPLDAGSEHYREGDEPAGPAEIADAVANVQCKLETNLIGVVVAVRTEYEEQYIQQNWEELRELKRWLDTVYRNSEQVLAERD